MAIDNIFLVLSDLHFGRDLHLPPELPPLQVTRMARWVRRDKDVERFVERNCRGHAFPCVSLLPQYLQTVLAEAQHEGFAESHDNTFDLCILLGDQATVPDAQSYRFLREYLTKSRYETVFGLGCDGLRLLPERILSIPGNHDKLLRSNLDIYHQEFTDVLRLPKIEACGSLFVSRLIGKHEFLFLFIDASVYAERELSIDIKCRSHLAAGEVSETLREGIRNKIDRIKQKEPVDEAELSGSYDGAVKIVLVHYAVDIARLPLQKTIGERFLPHECKGLKALITELKAKFKFTLALHGHMHVPELYNHDDVQVMSATTTTEQNGPNGFFVMKLLDTGEIRAEHHCWTGRWFSRDPNVSLTKQLHIYPRGAVA